MSKIKSILDMGASKVMSSKTFAAAINIHNNDLNKGVEFVEFHGGGCNESCNQCDCESYGTDEDVGTVSVRRSTRGVRSNEVIMK